MQCLTSLVTLNIGSHTHTLFLCFLILPQLVVFFEFHFPDDFGLIFSLEKAFLKCLVILRNRELVHLPQRTLDHSLLLHGKHKPRKVVFRTQIFMLFRTQTFTSFLVFIQYHPALIGTCLEQSLLRIRLTFPWWCWGRDGGMVEETSRGRNKSSLSIQPPTSLQCAEVHRYEVPMCNVCSLWLPDGLTPATSSFLYSIMPGSPGTNEQFSECWREREWALPHTSKNGFSPSLKRGKWGGDGSMGRHAGPATPKDWPLPRPCTPPNKGSVPGLSPVNWSLVTALWTDCSGLAISVKHSNKYKAPGSSSAEHSLLLLKKNLFLYHTFCILSECLALRMWETN